MTTKAKIRKTRIIRASDFWCGGGGTSTGLKQAIEEMNTELMEIEENLRQARKAMINPDSYILELTAVNHWETAVLTHSTNHPDTKHYCKAVDSLVPKHLFPDGFIKLFLASPECIGHSRARGGKPTTEQKRADAKDIERWVEQLYIENLIIENVEEFIDWGPLGKDGKPLKSKKGEYFRKFIEFLEITYKVEWRILNCADYGDATTRKRFFLLAKRGKNKKIVWPEPTHASRDFLAKCQPDLYNPDKQLKPWVPARSIINWNLKGKNVFGRKKELSGNTMKRIYAGLRKFSGIDVPERTIFTVKSLFDLYSKEKREKLLKQKFLEMRSADFEKKILSKRPDLIVPDFERIVRNEKGEIVEHYQEPAAEVLEQRRIQKQIPEDARYVVAPIKFDLSKFDPFVMGTGGPTGQQQPRSVEEPLRTILTDGRQNLFQPYMINLKGTERRMRSIDEPTFTQCASPNQQMLVEPFMLNISHTQNDHAGMCREIDEPLPSILGKASHGIVESFLVKYHGSEKGAHDINEPCSTLTTKERLAIVEAVLIPCNHGAGDVRTHSLDEPVPTITAVDAMGFAEPFLTKLYGGVNAASIDEPLGTVTANFEHFGLAKPYIVKLKNNQNAQDLSDPLGTLTTKESNGLAQPFVIIFDRETYWTVTPQIRMGIVEPHLVSVKDAAGKEIYGLLLLELGAILIINYRMLHENELAAAMSFPSDYFFAGKREDIVRQIGNAVPVKTAKALCKAQLTN